jgi:hypothetical protein
MQSLYNFLLLLNFELLLKLLFTTKNPSNDLPNNLRQEFTRFGLLIVTLSCFVFVFEISNFLSMSAIDLVLLFLGNDWANADEDENVLNFDSYRVNNVVFILDTS